MRNIPDTYTAVKDFNISLPFLGGGGDPAWTNIFTFQVPSHCRLILTHFSNYMETADWGEVTWRILRNGIPVVPYHVIVDPIGISTRPRVIERVIMTGGDCCEIQIAMSGVSVANNVGIALRYELEGL